MEAKNNNKIGTELHNNKSDFTKAHYHIYSKDKELEIKKIKRKKLCSTNNNFNLNNKNNNYIVFRHNTLSKLKEKDDEKNKKDQTKKNQKTMLIDQDLSKEINAMSFYYMNNINTNINISKIKNNSNQKKNQNLNRGSTSRKENKKIAKNLSRENVRGGGNNFLQGGTQRKKLNINDIENNNKILKLYDFNSIYKEDNTIISNANDIIFTAHKNKNNQEKKINNVILNSGNKYKAEKKISLVDKFSNNIDYHKNHNQIKIDTKNINNSINNNIIIQKSNISCKAQSNEKNLKHYIDLSNNNSKENMSKNIKNIIIENNNKNNSNFMNRFKSDVNLYNSYKINSTNNNNINTNDFKTKNDKEGMLSNRQNKKFKPLDFNQNSKLKIMNITSIKNKSDAKKNNNKTGLNNDLNNLNNKNLLKNKSNELLLNNINKNISNLITNNIKNNNNTKNNNIYITFINNASITNADFPKIKSTINCNSNINIHINKSNPNSNIKKLTKKSCNSINSITKLNTLQNEEDKKRIKYNNFKNKINFSSPKISSIYERHNTKPHLRRPLTNNQKNRNNDNTYSPKLNSIPKYLQTENNNSNMNKTNNNNLLINRLDVFENYSISSRKDNIFSKINNNTKNNSNYMSLLNKRKLSAKNQKERGNSLLKLIENKDKKAEKEKDIVNLTKRRPRRYDNEVNNLFTEISNVHNNKNSFFNFVFKKSNINSNNGIIYNKLLDNYNIKEEKNRKYSFINILKPKAISQQKRYNNIQEKEEKENAPDAKVSRDLKSLTYISKDKKKNISLLRKKKIIKLIHMIDEFNSSKSKSKSKNKNKSYNNNKRGASAIKERKKLTKFKFNYLGEEDNIIDNGLQNNITRYSIYILSKYYDNFKKVGLAKIKLYDKNNNELFIVDSNSNRLNNKEENVNYLFDMKKHCFNNRPFISDYKDYLYINFYVNFKKTNIIKYIKIINYENIEEKISPVKEIKISHGKKTIFQGILNMNTNNIIDISENKNNSESKECPYSTVTKKRGNSANAKNCNSMMSNEIYNSNYKRNNTKSYSSFRASSGKKNNKIPKKQLVKINSERNISNKDEESIKYDKKFSKYLSYHNTEIDENNNLGNYKLIENICKTINYNNNNESDNNLLIRERFISDNNIKIESNIHESINIQKFNLNKNSFQKEEQKTINIINNNNSSSCIKFKKLKLILSSNYGHPHYIGLTGLEFYDINNKLIDIETADTIGALPKDLHTVYNNDDGRIFENIFNGENNIDDSYNMWVTLFDSSNRDLPFIELTFNKDIYLSKIIFFNYNKKNELDICLKTVDIILDDKYYNTIYLRQGLGEIINENIIQKENSNINNNEKKEGNNENNNKNYCQEIYFPINNNCYDKIYKDKNHFTNRVIFEDELKVEYASNKYEQCYETPYMPNGQIIKFQLVNNFYKGTFSDNILANANTNSANNILIKHYNYFGINIVKIYDENGNDLLTQKNIKYKIISNKEMIISDRYNIILNCFQNENSDNNIYFLFDNSINISYIEINPFTFFGGLNKNDKNYLNSAKDIKIFCDTAIIFEGELYNYQPTIILFTSNEKILKNFDKKYLTKKSFERIANENVKKDCYSMIFKD